MTHAMVFVGVHLEVCADVASTAAYIHTTSICSVIAITCIVDQRVSFFVRFGSSFLARICCFSDYLSPVVTFCYIIVLSYGGCSDESVYFHTVPEQPLDRMESSLNGNIRIVNFSSVRFL